MTDLTPEARISEAEAVVREQRRDHVASEVVVRQGADPATAPADDYVDADDWRDLRFELERLQRAVMGEPQTP